MLLEIFVAVEVLTFLVAGFAFYTRNPMIWGFVGIMAAILAISSFGIETRDYVRTSSVSSIDTATNVTTVNYVNQSVSTIKPDVAMFGLNIGMFLLSIVMLYFTIYEEIQK
jgi:hypothetical protein